MNEWYQPVNNYKLEEHLTWPQLANRWGVSERELRRKDRPPSDRVIAKIREFLPEQYLPADLKAQADIFAQQLIEKTTGQIPITGESDSQGARMEIESGQKKEAEVKREAEEKSEAYPRLSFLKHLPLYLFGLIYWPLLS